MYTRKDSRFIGCLMAAALLMACVSGEDDSSPTASPWRYSRTLDLTESSMGCVSVESMSEDVTLLCGDHYVKRCDDVGKQPVDVYATPELTEEEVFWAIRLKGCQVP